MGIWSRLADWLASSETESEPGWIRRLVIPRGKGRPDPELDVIKHDAAEDVTRMEEEDRRYFRHDAPGHIEDDL
jgi:hypothetical protein